MSDIRFTSFPRTEPPQPFVGDVVAVFQQNEPTISTVQLKKGLTMQEAR